MSSSMPYKLTSAIGNAFSAGNDAKIEAIPSPSVSTTVPSDVAAKCRESVTFSSIRHDVLDTRSTSSLGPRHL